MVLTGARLLKGMNAVRTETRIQLTFVGVESRGEAHQRGCNQSAKQDKAHYPQKMTRNSPDQHASVPSSPLRLGREPRAAVGRVRLPRGESALRSTSGG